MRVRWRAGSARWLGVAVLTMGAPAVAAPQGGNLYTSQAGNFRIRMSDPNRVMQQSLSVSGIQVALSMAMYEAPSKQGAYAVSYADFPAQVIRAGSADTFLANSARGMAGNTGSTIQQQTPIRFGAYSGLDIVAEGPPKGGPEPTAFRARIVLVGNRLYQILLAGQKSWVEAEDYRGFRDSFALIQDPPPAVAVAAPAPAPAMPRAAPAPPPRFQPPAPPRGQAFVGESGPDPAEPAEVDLRVEYDSSKALDRINQGGMNDNPFRDLAPPGGVLVGVRVGYVNAWGGWKLGWVRPIYQVGAGYVEGETSGNAAADLGEARVVAKPGYVVAGINYRQGLIVDGLQLVFGKVKMGKVDLRDAYTSPWLGDANGGSLMFVSGEGRFIAGIVGRSGRQEISGIGLSVAAGPVTAKVTGPPPGAPRPKPAAREPSPSPAARPAPSVASRDPDPEPEPGPGPAAAPAPVFVPAPSDDPQPAADAAALAAAARRPAPDTLAVSYDSARLADMPPADPGDRDAFRDLAPRGGVLVGVRVGTVGPDGGPIGSIQPIYQLGAGYVPGRRHGAAAVRGGATLMARPGFAVGALNVRAGPFVDALQVVFMRVEDGRLNPGDSYTSDWLGSPSGGGLATVSGGGRPVAGLRGRTNGREIDALGLVVGN